MEVSQANGGLDLILQCKIIVFYVLPSIYCKVLQYSCVAKWCKLPFWILKIAMFIYTSLFFVALTYKPWDYKARLDNISVY